MLSCIAYTFPAAVSAQVVFTELMYDVPGSDSGREWVEVFNAGAAPVKLTAWKLNENDTNHKIVAVEGGDILAPDSYTVIAASPSTFKAEWPKFSGQLFDSAFSLSNDGETISLRTASSTVVDSVTYSSSLGASGDGNSLNRAPGSSEVFVPRAPSPGAPMSSNIIPKVEKPLPAPKSPKTKSTLSKSASAVVIHSAVLQDLTGEVLAADTATGGERSAPLPAPSENSSYLWWAGAAALALAAGGGVAASRRAAKTEWDIVEEK